MPLSQAASMPEIPRLQQHASGEDARRGGTAAIHIAQQHLASLCSQNVSASLAHVPLQCFFQRNVGHGEELARRRMNMLNDELCLLSDSGDILKIQDEDVVSPFFEQDAIRHGQDEGSHGFVLNLMLLRN